jgi:cytoskeletal protein CcmA (bactofilin family)
MVGDIKTNGDIRIDGNLSGSITAKGKVVIGGTGRIEGEVLCQNANVSGEIKGKLQVAELLSLQASAKIQGDIVTGKLVVENGAMWNGTVKMGAVIKELNLEDSKEQQEKTA